MRASLCPPILSTSPENTAALAIRLADHLGAGDTLCLTGGLGSGKSHVARSIIRHLTGEIDVPSPTFTLVQTYDAPDFAIWHADLYRLSDPNDIAELGLQDAFGNALCLIEWPDRLEEPPSDALWLSIEPGPTDEDRTLTLSSDEPQWTERVTGLAQGIEA